MPVEKGSSIVKLSLPSVSFGSRTGSSYVPDVAERLYLFLIHTGRVCRDLVSRCFFFNIETQAGDQSLPSAFQLLRCYRNFVDRRRRGEAVFEQQGGSRWFQGRELYFFPSTGAVS